MPGYLIQYSVASMAAGGCDLNVMSKCSCVQGIPKRSYSTIGQSSSDHGSK